MRFILHLLVLFLCSSTAFSQSTFERYISSTSGIEAGDIICTSDGGFMITGKQIASLEPVLLIKLDSAYNVQWTLSIGDTTFNGESGRNIIQTFDKSYFINTGGALWTDPAEISFLKTDSNGSVLWSRAIGTVDVDKILDIIETDAGSIVLVGCSFYMGLINGPNIVIMKVSKAGDLLWIKTLGGTQWDEAKKIIEANGKYYLFGFSDSFSQRGPYVVTTDTSGNVLWSKIVGSLQERIMDVASTPDGGFVIVGTSFNNLGSSIDTTGFVLKIDSTGIEEWVNTYKLSSSTYWEFYFSKVLVNGIGDIFIKGFSHLMCLDSSGLVKWNNRYSASRPVGIVPTADLGYLMIGNSEDSLTNLPIIQLIKTDSIGRTECSASAFVETGFGLHVPLYNVTTMTDVPPDTLDTHTTIANSVAVQTNTICSDGTGVYGNESNEFDFRVFPNPFSAELNISMQYTSSEMFEVEILDLLGKIKYFKKITGGNSIVDLSGLISGTYFLRIKNDKIIVSYQIIKITD